VLDLYLTTAIPQGAGCLLHEHGAALGPNGAHGGHGLLGPALAEIALLPADQVGVVPALRLVAQVLREAAGSAHGDVVHLQIVYAISAVLL
jgi:hypothetical protein